MKPSSSAITASTKSVCWAGRKIQARLGSLEESLAGEPPGTDGDLRLTDLIADSGRVATGIDDRQDALLLVRLEVLPTERCQDGDDAHREDDDAPPKPPGGRRPG